MASTNYNCVLEKSEGSPTNLSRSARSTAAVTSNAAATRNSDSKLTNVSARSYSPTVVVLTPHLPASSSWDHPRSCRRAAMRSPSVRNAFLKRSSSRGFRPAVTSRILGVTPLPRHAASLDFNLERKIDRFDRGRLDWCRERRPLLTYRLTTESTAVRHPLLTVQFACDTHSGERGKFATARIDVRLTEKALSCAARAYVAMAARRTACLHVSCAMQAARRRSGFDFTRRLGRRAGAGPRRLLGRVRPRACFPNASDSLMGLPAH